MKFADLRFKEGDPQGTMPLFAEGALVLIVLERFVRMLLGEEATDDDTVPALLEKATSQRLGLLRLPGSDRDRVIRERRDVRNALLHGNDEQAARHWKPRKRRRAVKHSAPMRVPGEPAGGQNRARFILP